MRGQDSFQQTFILKVGKLFKIDGDMVGGGIREFVYNLEGSAFLKRELVRICVDRNW